MKNVRKITLVLLLALALFGCSSGGAPAAESSAPASSAPTESQEAPPEAPTAEPSPAASGDVDFICVYGATKVKMFEMFDKFNADNPNINLNVTTVSGPDINKQLMILAAGDSLPDIVTIDGLFVQSFAAMGILEDITDRAQNDLGFDLDLFYPAPLSANIMNDRYYGLPFSTNCIAIFYNKTLLEQNGFEEPTPDWTWDDFTEIAIGCADPANGIYGASICSMASEDGTFHFYPWFWGAGGDSFQIDSQAGRDALGFYQNLVNNNAMSTEIINWNQTDAGDQFVGGKAALFSGGCWHLASFETNITDFEYGVVTHPVHPETGQFATTLGGYSFNLIKGGNVDAAWEFVKFMESAETMAYYNPPENYIPARKDVAESLEHYTSEDSLMSVYRSAMESAGMRGPHYFWLDIEAPYQNMLQKVILGADIDESLAEAQAAVDKILEK